MTSPKDSPVRERRKMMMLLFVLLLIDIAQGSVIAPPEVICRQGEYVVRAIKFNLAQTDVRLNIFLSARDFVEHARLFGCYPTSIVGSDFNYTGTYGARCYLDGIKFYYRDLGVRDADRFRSVRIRGTRIPGGLSYSLITPGLIDLHRTPDSPRDGLCLNLAHPTSICYRATGQTCSSNHARCVQKVANNDEYECLCRPGFRMHPGGGLCLDIDECASGNHICNTSTHDCRNLNGSYWCERKTPLPSCPGADQVNLGGIGEEYCVPKEVVTPSEVFCKMLKWTNTRLVFPAQPAEEPLANKVLSSVQLVWSDNRNNTHTKVLIDVVCEGHPFTNLPPELMTPTRPYEIVAAAPGLVRDTRSEMMDLIERDYVGHPARVGIRCFSNALFVWTLYGAKLLEVNAGNITLTYRDARRTMPERGCKKVGVSDICFWRSHGCNRTKQVCALEDNVRCRCKSGFQGQNCTGEELCGDGLRIVGNKCVDIDECNYYPCGGNQTCKNVYGGYECVSAEDCSRGFRFVNLTCVDIDECAEGTDVCDHRSTDCVNTEGGYTCACKDRRQFLTATLTSCETPVYQYRLLRHLRCCSHRRNTFFYLVKGRMGEDASFSEILPEACLEVSTIDHSQVPWAYSKPYVVQGDGDLEIGALLELVDMYRRRRRKEALAVVLNFKDWCRRTYAVGGNITDATQTVYISYIPPSKTYFDPRDFASRSCRNRMGTNVEWLAKRLAPTTPAKRSAAVNYACSSSSSAAAFAAIRQAIKLCMVSLTLFFPCEVKSY